MKPASTAIYQTKLIASAGDLDSLVAATADPVILLEGIRALPDKDVAMVRRFGRWVAARASSFALDTLTHVAERR